jgi:putative oxidoreductase
MRLYCTVHGAQKLFAAFGGPGLGQAGAGFDRIGLTPGKPMAALAGATELGGGLLTAAGAADPAGGPLAANRGFELPLTNLPAAAALAASRPGRFRLSPPPSPVSWVFPVSRAFSVSCPAVFHEVPL